VSGDVSLPAGQPPAGRASRDRIQADIIAARQYVVAVNEALETTDLSAADSAQIAADLTALTRSVMLASARAAGRAEQARHPR
jgi:hypothetical protein